MNKTLEATIADELLDGDDYLSAYREKYLGEFMYLFEGDEGLSAALSYLMTGGPAEEFLGKPASLVAVKRELEDIGVTVWQGMASHPVGYSSAAGLLVSRATSHGGLQTLAEMNVIDNQSMERFYRSHIRAAQTLEG
jgi:hypothetical protein